MVGTEGSTPAARPVGSPTPDLVTPVPKRGFVAMLLGCTMMALPTARFIAWRFDDELIGAPVARPSATNVVLLLGGIFFAVMSGDSWVTREYMTRFLKRTDLKDPARAVVVRPAWAVRRRSPRLGLDLGNSKETFGWVPLRNVRGTFDPTAPFGVAGPVGVKHGAVLVSPDTGQILVSARTMTAIAPDRRLHPLGGAADRLLGWTATEDLPTPLAAGKVHVADWGPTGASEAVDLAAQATDARRARALKPIAYALGILIVVLMVAPAGRPGLIIAITIGIGAPAAVVATSRWILRPLAAAVQDHEELSAKDARVLASMLLLGGLGRRA